jgi:hypothetical protein
MKKIILIATILIFTLSSFGVKKSNNNYLDKKPILKMRYYFHCTDGSMNGSFIANSLSEAQDLANSLCS